VTDIEHELVRENQALRHRVAALADLARRSLVTAVAAQDRADGEHEPWLDDELTALDQELADPV
jgi:hypothetical protein